jgi:hypothetical protein
MVVSLLAQSPSFAFTLGGVTIDGRSLSAVKAAIENGRIGVNYAPLMGKDSCRYSYKRNRLILGFRSIQGDITREANIIHEVIHAAIDAKNVHVPLRSAQAIAHIGEALFVFQKRFVYGEGAVANYLRPQLKLIGAIRAAAWSLAANSGSAPSPTESELAPLWQAIDGYPAYHYRLQTDLARD